MVLPHPRSGASVSPPPTTRAAATPGRPSLTVSLTSGAEAPLRALADAPHRALIVCHPYDAAVVAHLLAHVGRTDCLLQTGHETAHGTLGISVRLAVAS